MSQKFAFHPRYKFNIEPNIGALAITPVIKIFRTPHNCATFDESNLSRIIAKEIAIGAAAPIPWINLVTRKVSKLLKRTQPQLVKAKIPRPACIVFFSSKRVGKRAKKEAS